MVDFKEVALPLTYKTRNRLVCGIGVNDAWYVTERKEDGVVVKCPYSMKWKSMLTQVSKLVKRNNLPITEFVCSEWLKFSNFRAWMEHQNWKEKEFTLKDTYPYSPTTCTFIPDRKGNLVCGVGLYLEGKYKGYDSTCGKKNGMTKEYSLWSGMLQRCYTDYQKSGRNLTYVDCTVSENFKNFQYFAEWCQGQAGFGLRGWHLDKDILAKGNKTYSEDNCIFVPSELNVLFNKKKKQRGEYPIGVSKSSKPTHNYSSCCNHEGRQVWLGYHSSVESAFSAYKTFKESVVKEAAVKWKDQIDPRAYQALMKYQVEITD